MKTRLMPNLLQVEEDALLVPRLQELITSASAELYGATR